MSNFKIFLVSFDRLDKRVISNLTPDEIDHLLCYSVNRSVLKMFQTKLPIINEWELPWYSSHYQNHQYYEYGTIIHAIKNPHLLEGLSNVGLMHYDMIFPANSINNIQSEIEKNPQQIFYVVKRNDALYFTDKQLSEVCNYLNSRLGINSSVKSIKESGWISEALSIVPVEIFKNFGQFLLDNYLDIENMLIKNRWGIMDNCNHRVCGIIERFWGIYLVSCGLPIVQTNIIHDWDYYKHEHLTQKNWIVR
jgi:hypothetical protein